VLFMFLRFFLSTGTLLPFFSLFLYERRSIQIGARVETINQVDLQELGNLPNFGAKRPLEEIPRSIRAGSKVTKNVRQAILAGAGSFASPEVLPRR
jgi:hypothetical protein